MVPASQVINYVLFCFVLNNILNGPLRILVGCYRMLTKSMGLDESLPPVKSMLLKSKVSYNEVTNS